jgi:hypothetical protein
MAELAPGFREEIDRELRAYEWHPRAHESARYSEEFRTELHAALDAKLDNADSSVVEKISADLNKFGGLPWSRERSGAAPSGKEKARLK